MRKGMWIVLLLLMVTAYGCGKQEKKSQVEDNTPIEVQVPTEKPTDKPTEAPTEQPTKKPDASSQPAGESSEDTVKIMEYLRMDLPEEYTTLVDDKNQVITIAKDGKKIGRITLKQSYRGKRQAATMAKELLEKEGYAKSVKTYQKDSYLMCKVKMETGLTKQEIESGKLFSGNEELMYFYYKNQTPTNVLVFEVANLEMEAAMDRIAETIELLR